ncbi:MAG: ATP-binding protein [Candidatus Gastranaerophilaceae bacterium]
MFVKFSVQNFLSFKDLNSLELIASNITQHEENTIDTKQYKLLKSVAIFGANASGKSNLFKAMQFARDFVLSSSKESQANEKIHVTPFLLSTKTESEPSLFEFVFLKNNTKYRYGFRLNNSIVVDEWLFAASKVKESLLFERHEQDIKVGAKFKEGSKIIELTRKNALFLSVVAQFNGKIAESIIEWFYGLRIITGLQTYNSVTIEYLKALENKKEFMDILNIADSSIQDFQFKELDIEKAPKYIKEELERIKALGAKYELMPEIKTYHNKYNDKNNVAGTVEFDFNKNESKGTQHLFSLTGPILDTIENSNILVIDEFECNLHPLISRFLIKLFHLKNKNAQFIFNTHDTKLLNNKYFRRDQIYFVDKDQFGGSSLYSLYDYNIRYDRTFDKDYLEGKYKAIPFIDEYGIFGNEID